MSEDHLNYLKMDFYLTQIGLYDIYTKKKNTKIEL